MTILQTMYWQFFIFMSVKWKCFLGQFLYGVEEGRGTLTYPDNSRLENIKIWSINIFHVHMKFNIVLMFVHLVWFRCHSHIQLIHFWCSFRDLTEVLSGIQVLDCNTFRYSGTWQRGQPVGRGLLTLSPGKCLQVGRKISQLRWIWWAFCFCNVSSWYHFR